MSIKPAQILRKLTLLMFVTQGFCKYNCSADPTCPSECCSSHLQSEPLQTFVPPICSEEAEDERACRGCKGEEKLIVEGFYSKTCTKGLKNECCLASPSCPAYYYLLSPNKCVEGGVYRVIKYGSLATLIVLAILISIFLIDPDMKKHSHNKIYVLILIASLLLSLKYFVGTFYLNSLCSEEGFLFYFIFLMYLAWKCIWIIDLHLCFNSKISATSTTKLLVYVFIGVAFPAFFTMILEFFKHNFNPQESLMSRVSNFSFLFIYFFNRIRFMVLALLMLGMALV
jgi:hypothetical protein